MMSGYLHNLNPFAIRFTENFGIRWYGLSYLAGFVISYLIVRWLARRNLSPIKEDQAGDFIFTVAIGTIIGGRLGYCIFYSPDLFSTFTKDIPFWSVLAVNQGGMASHGGIFGIICACIYFAKKNGIPILHAIDLTAFCGGPGIFLGRIANFINGELVGREAPKWLPWGVRFPQDILLWPTYEPGRLHALTPVVEKLGVSSEQWNSILSNMNISPSSFAFVNRMLAQILDAVRQYNYAVSEILAPLLTLRHPSQLYEALLEGLFLFVVLLIIWRVPRKPGIIAGFFLTLYPLVRIFGEQFRMPDAQIGFQWLGLTRGQWLSVVMLVIGIACVVWWSRKNVEKIGGWGKCNS